MSDSVVENARELYQQDKDGWSEIYTAAIADLQFQGDDPSAQWFDGSYQERVNSGRIAVSIDQLGQFINQTINDVRMNTPTIRVIPDTDADLKTAEAIQGTVRNIEYQSNADVAYDTALDFAVRCGIGFFRVDHEYVGDTFEQRLCIKRIINPMAVILDSDSIEIDGSDAKHAFVCEKISKRAFMRQYPDAMLHSFEDDKPLTSTSSKDYLMLAEFFKIEGEEKEYGLKDDGTIEVARQGGSYARTRKIVAPKVKRFLMSGSEILKETTFPGKYIPVIPVMGQELWIDGQRNLFSLIRKSKQAQAHFNLWKSIEADLLLNMPKAQWLAPMSSTESFREEWTNPDFATVLRYQDKDANGNQLARPERITPPTPPTGIIGAARMAVDDIKATMGLYSASIGARGNETSGVAIQARKIEGDVATFHFGDNLTKSIQHCGRVIVEALPEVYDTARYVQIVTPEEETRQIGINGQMAPDQEQSYDFTKGTYTVKVVTGASFTTKRQETADFLQKMIQAYPDTMMIGGDLFFKNLDMPGANAIAERLKKVIESRTPGLTDEGAQQDVQKEQMQATIQQMTQVIQALEGQMAQMQQSFDSKQAEIELKAQSAMTDAETDRMKLLLDEQKLQFERDKLQAQTVLEQQKLQLEEIKLKAEIIKAAQQSVGILPDSPEMGLENPQGVI